VERGDASGETGPPLPEYLSANEVAELLQVSPTTVARWAAEGRLPFETTARGERRFRRADIEDLLRRIRGET
jgi:excisionase family DNA binding protein